MKTDGSVIIDTKISSDGMEKGFEEIKSGMDSVAADAQRTSDRINSSFSKVDFSKPVANAVAKVQALEQKLAGVTSEFNLAVSDGDDRAAERLAAKRISLYDRLEAAREKLAIEVAAAAQKEAAAEEKAAQKATKAVQREAAAKERATQKQFAKMTKSARQFGTRFRSIVSGALVFNLISSGLRQATEYFGTALKSNDQFSKSFANLKGALLTAFQPIYELLLPAIISLMNIATKAAQAIANIFATLTGKTTSEMAKNAQALYEQANATDKLGKEAKKATKSLAGFDEIQKLSAPDASAATEEVTASKPDFSAFDSTEYQSKIEKMVVLTSMALLAIGAILAFSGINIPLGIGMMALGAAGLVSQIATNWSAVQDALSGGVGAVVAILSTALLALGAVLAFSGANVPLGIGLMLVGAIGLGTSIAANWNSIIEAMQGPIGAVVAIVSTALLAIGAILVFSGAGIPLGIGLLAAGAVGLVTAAATNWDTVKSKIGSVLAGLLAILSAAAIVIGVLLCFTGAGLGIGLALILAGIAGSVVAVKANDNPVTRFVAGIVNAIIGLINLLISAINMLFHIKFDGLKIGDVQVIPKIDFKLLDIPKIPLLAKGAVIPPNAPFAAILGDQRHGTNIEAPLSTIQEAVALVMEDYAAANIAGHEATVAILRDILEAILGIHVGDDVIGQAVARYNARMAIIKGGNA